MSRDWNESDHPRDDQGRFTDGPDDWVSRVSAALAPPEDVETVIARYGEADLDAIEVNGKPVDVDERRHDFFIDHGSEFAAKGVEWWIEDDLRAVLADALRAGQDLRKVPDGESLNGATVKFSNMHQRLYQAVREGRLTRDVQLWRGLVVHEDQIDRLFPVGAEVSDQSFAATSMHSQHALSIMRWRLESETDPKMVGVYLQILAPAGTHVATGAVDVRELILAPKVRTRVVGRPRPDIIVLEVVADGIAD